MPVKKKGAKNANTKTAHVLNLITTADDPNGDGQTASAPTGGQPSGDMAQGNPSLSQPSMQSGAYHGSTPNSATINVAMVDDNALSLRIQGALTEQFNAELALEQKTARATLAASRPAQPAPLPPLDPSLLSLEPFDSTSLPEELFDELSPPANSPLPSMEEEEYEVDEEEVGEEEVGEEEDSLFFEAEHIEESLPLESTYTEDSPPSQNRDVVESPQIPPQEAPQAPYIPPEIPLSPISQAASQNQPDFSFSPSVGQSSPISPIQEAAMAGQPQQLPPLSSYEAPEFDNVPLEQVSQSPPPIIPEPLPPVPMAPPSTAPIAHVTSEQQSADYNAPSFDQVPMSQVSQSAPPPPPTQKLPPVSSLAPDSLFEEVFVEELELPPSTNQFPPTVGDFTSQPSAPREPSPLQPQQLQPQPLHAQQFEPMDLQPQQVVPQELQPQQIVPQELQPQQIVPQELQPQQLEPQQVVPQELQPQQTVPQELQPQQTVPQELQPQQTVPQELQPQQVVPQELQPQQVESQEFQSQQVMPQELQPQQVMPQELQPQQIVPQELQPPVAEPMQSAMSQPDFMTEAVPPTFSSPAESLPEPPPSFQGDSQSESLFIEDSGSQEVPTSIFLDPILPPDAVSPSSISLEPSAAMELGAIDPVETPLDFQTVTTDSSQTQFELGQQGGFTEFDTVMNDDSFDPLNPMLGRKLGEPVEYYNLTEALVREMAPKFLQTFGTCTCEQCLLDVIAHTLCHLKPKYVVRYQSAFQEVQSDYKKEFASAIVSQLGKSCIAINEKPRHLKPFMGNT